MITTNTKTNRAPTVSYNQRLRPYFLTLARRLQSWSDSRGEGFSIGVSSFKKREGKSTIAFNLAAAMAGLQTENVLLVEADFGNPALSKRMPACSAGLTELICGVGSVEECVVPTSIDHLHILGCGKLNAREAQEKPLESIHSLNSEFRADYRYAIYDLPIVDELNLALLVAKQLDGTVMVVDSNHVDPKAIARLRKRSEEYGVEMIGLVLNKTTPTKRS